MPENEQADDRNTHRKDNGNDETYGVVLHAVDEVHTEERCYQRGQHEDDGSRGQRTHDGVHVVVDNRLVGVHRRLQDVGVDAGGLACLRHLDVDILDEVGVQLVYLQLELQLLQQVLVASDGGVEVGQRVLQTGQSDERLVVHLAVQVALGFLDEHRYLLQALQVPDG